MTNRTSPLNEIEYQVYNAVLSKLLDIIGEDEFHPLVGLLARVETFVITYENTHCNLPEVSPIEILKSLMTEHQLKQTDLLEIGSQGVVSEILSGKRQLNVRQIQALSQRFGLSPAVFFSTLNQDCATNGA